MHTAQQKKQAARSQIDAADKQLVSLISKFKMASTDTPRAHNDIVVGGDMMMFREDAPRHLLRLVVDNLDTNGLDEKMARVNILQIAQALSSRFHALENVARSKKAQGHTDSYDKERHEQVIQRGADGVEKAGGDRELGKKIFNVIADEFVSMQNQYLQEQKGPIATFIDKKNSTGHTNAPGWSS